MPDNDHNMGMIVSIEKEENREKKKQKLSDDANLMEQNSEFESLNDMIVKVTFRVSERVSYSNSEHSVSTTSFQGSFELTREQYPDMIVGQTGEELTMRNGSRAEEESGLTKVRCLLFVVALLILLCYFGHSQSITVLDETLEDTIYIPGAGFSGFWFTLGRLRSIEDPASKHYYCFSAGCLGVVASLRNFTVDEMLDLAEDIQGKWKRAQIGRHEVVGEFVDSLVNASSSVYSTLRSIEEPSILSRLHIVTSAKDKWMGLKARTRSPQTSDELREMLLQTTWM